MTWSTIFFGSLGFILFGNEEGRVSYDAGDLNPIIQKKTPRLLRIDVLRLEAEQALLLENIKLHNNAKLNQ